MRRAWLHFSPAFCSLQITDSHQLIISQKELFILAAVPYDSATEDIQEEQCQKILADWDELIRSNDVTAVRITFSPGMNHHPALPFIRNQLQSHSWPAPIYWSAAEEVKAISAPVDQTFDLLVCSCEHTLYLIQRQAATPLWHAALPLGLSILKQTYCQNEPPDSEMLIAMRRQIVHYLELIQFHTRPLKPVLISDVAYLLARLRPSSTANQLLARKDIEFYLSYLSREPIAVACRHLDINTPLGNLLLPTAIVAEHILDYLQLADIEVLPCALQLVE